MAKIKVVNLKGENVKDLTLADNIWNVEVNESVLKDAIVFTQNNLRQGTASTKTRGEVRGGGKKPYRQKGTGQARQGSIRSPQWPGGGIVFGPKPRFFSKKQNKKERRLALLSALTLKFKEKELIVVDSFKDITSKTNEFVKILNNLKVTSKALIVHVDNDNLVLATRNNKSVVALDVSKINVLDLVNNKCLVIEEEAIIKLEEVLK